MRFLIVIGLALTLISVVGAQEASAGAPQNNSAVQPSADQGNDSAAKEMEGRSTTQTSPASEGSKGTIIPPPPSRKDISEAKRDFKVGVKLKSSGRTEAAFEQFEQASRLDPRNVDYVTAREFARQQLVMQALDRGNKAMQAKNELVATAEFRQALAYDPSNEFARQRLNDSVWETEPAPSRTLQVVQKSLEVSVSPSSERKDFEFRGDSRTLLTQVAKAYGITATI